MDYNKEELEIIRIILDIEDNITIKNVFLKIIDILKEKKRIKYTYENNKYVFKDKKSIEKLRLISEVIEELINSSLIKISDRKEKKSLKFNNSKGNEINDFMLIKLEEISGCYFYKTPRLRKIFSKTIFLVILFIIFIIISILFLILIFSILKKELNTTVRISIFLIILIIIVITLFKIIKLVNKNGFDYKAWKYPYLRESFFLKDLQSWILFLTFFGVIISFFKK